MVLTNIYRFIYTKTFKFVLLGNLKWISKFRLKRARTAFML